MALKKEARKREHPLHPRNQHLTLKATVAKTAFPELGFRVTVDAASQRIDISGAVHCLLRQTETTIYIMYSTIFSLSTT